MISKLFELFCFIPLYILRKFLIFRMIMRVIKILKTIVQCYFYVFPFIVISYLFLFPQADYDFKLAFQKGEHGFSYAGILVREDGKSICSPNFKGDIPKLVDCC